MINFNDDTWRHVVSTCEKLIEQKKNECLHKTKSFEDVLEVRGFVHALKTIINLPQDIAANKGK